MAKTFRPQDKATHIWVCSAHSELGFFKHGGINFDTLLFLKCEKIAEVSVVATCYKGY